MLLYLLQEECVNDLPTAQFSKVIRNSYRDSAISSTSGYNSGLESKSEDSIHISDNSVTHCGRQSSDNEEKTLS